MRGALRIPLCGKYILRIPTKRYALPGDSPTASSDSLTTVGEHGEKKYFRTIETGKLGVDGELCCGRQWTATDQQANKRLRNSYVQFYADNISLKKTMLTLPRRPADAPKNSPRHACSSYGSCRRWIEKVLDVYFENKETTLC